MVRQAWEWLLVRYEPILVGLAITLCSLAWVANRSPNDADAAHQPISSQSARAAELAVDPALFDVPDDPQYYRDRWLAEAAAFYAAHPPAAVAEADADRSETGATAAEEGADRVGRKRLVAQPVSFSTPAAYPGPVSAGPLSAGAVSAGAAAAVPAVNSAISDVSVVAVAAVDRSSPRVAVSGWLVAACVFAGIVVAAAFHWAWPASPAAEPLSPAASPTPRAEPPVAAREPVATLEQWQPADGGRYALTIPRAWVAIRPSAGESLRRGIVGFSYLLAALGSWAVFQL